MCSPAPGTSPHIANRLMFATTEIRAHDLDGSAHESGIPT